MALFNDFSDRNKRLISGRVVRYHAEPVRYSENGLEPRTIYWEVSRDSDTRFEYFGMTKAAAEACVEAMREMFTRNYMRWNAVLTDRENDYPDVTIDAAHVVECGSGIGLENTEGDNHSVIVDVSESDEIVTLAEPKTREDFEALFQEAELRDGQESGMIGLAIGAAAWLSEEDEIRVTFTNSITGFNPSLLGVDVYQGGSWQPVSSGISVAGAVLTFPATSNQTFRLNYNSGQYLSKKWTTSNRKTYKLAIESASFTIDVEMPGNASLHPYYDWAGKADIRLSVLCSAQIPTLMASYRVESRFGSQQKSVSPYLIEPRGFDSTLGKYRYDVFAMQSLPPEEQPFEDVAVWFYPANNPDLLSSDPYEFDQVDYINITTLSAVKSGSNYNVTVNFATNLPATSLANKVAFVHSLYGGQTQTVDYYDVTYAAAQGGGLVATFSVPETAAGLYASGLVSISGINATTGVEVNSVWRQIALGGNA